MHGEGGIVVLESQIVLLNSGDHFWKYDLINVLGSRHCSVNNTKGSSSAIPYPCPNENTSAAVSVMLLHAAGSESLSWKTMDSDAAVVKVHGES